MDEIIKKIDDAVNRINNGVPTAQRQLYDELLTLTQKLEVSNSRIKSTAKNVRLIGEIKKKLELLLRNPSYNKDVNEFIKSFTEVAQLQKDYFQQSVKNFTPPKVLQAIREESVQATIESLQATDESEYRRTRKGNPANKHHIWCKIL